MKSDSDTSLNQPSFVVSSYRKFSTVSVDVSCMEIQFSVLNLCESLYSEETENTSLLGCTA